MRLYRVHGWEPNMNRRRYGDIARYALYDAGNSNYVTLIPSLVFPVYFQTVVAEGRASGDAIWGALLLSATLLAALLGPIVGNLADRRAAKFSLLRWTSWMAVGGTMCLALVVGQGILLIGVLFVLTQTSYLLATVLYDSALADVSSRKNAARISSLAWGVGYLGGLVGLLFTLATRSPRDERFGVIFIIAAVFFFVLSLPLVLRRSSRPSAATSAPPTRASFLALVRTFMADPVRSRMFWAFFLYSNGVNAVIYFTALFALTTLGYSLEGLMWLFVVMNLVAAPSAILFGRVAERLGQIRTLKGVVAAWIGVVLVLSLAEKSTFAVVACAAASLIGPVQALSRSLFRIIFPETAMSSFFGVQAMAMRGAALVGPILFGLVSWATGSQRIGALTAAALFAVGLWVLYRLPPDVEKEGAAC